MLEFSPRRKVFTGYWSGKFPFVPIDYDPHPNWTSNRLAGSVIPEELFRSRNLLTIAFKGVEGSIKAQSILKTNEPGLG